MSAIKTGTGAIDRSAGPLYPVDQVPCVSAAHSGIRDSPAVLSVAAGLFSQYSRSKISTMSPMTPSSQWHRTRAPQSLTSGAQLAGAKGMTERSSMGMSF